MRYRLQRHDGTDCSATMVPITVLRMVPIQRYRHVHLIMQMIPIQKNFTYNLRKNIGKKEINSNKTIFLET